MSSYHLAQINLGKFQVEPNDPVNDDFMNALDEINAAAEAADGFIWRLVGDGNNATDIRMFDDPLLLMNMSVWRDVASLHAFAYRHQGHAHLLGRKAEWFTPIEQHLALWWIKAGHIPTPAEGMAKIDHLRKNGPTAEAFTFKTRFEMPQE